MMAKRLAPVLKAHGVIDEHGAYVAPVFSTPELPPQLGEYLFQRLSPAFRFKVDPALLPPTFALSRTAGDTVEMQPYGFMLGQGAPVMGGNILTGQLRTAGVFACYLIRHPAVVASLPEAQGLSPSTFALYGAILVKETLIGMLLGYLSGMLFWTIQCAGFFIDNQRGASMAEGADPLSGEQTWPLGSFFFRSAVYLFFSTGAFLALLGVVYASYEIWPVTQLIPLSVFKDINLPLFFAGRVSWLLLMMLLLSGPIVVACLLTDVSLGLINRFASQLNVYVLAMPIKSGVAAFLMLFYFMMLLSNATGLFDGVKADFEQLRRLLP